MSDELDQNDAPAPKPFGHKALSWRHRRWSNAGLAVGVMPPGGPRRFGFGQATAIGGATRGKLVRLKTEGHAITFAATGAGKGVGTMIPNVLLHDGPLVCVDPMGDTTRVCARRRRELGDRVVILDPFGVVADETDSLNPLDLMTLPGAHNEDNAETIAWELAAGHECSRDPFWVNSATALLAGVISRAGTRKNPEERTLPAAIDTLYADDLDYRLAVILDQKDAGSRFAHQRIAAYLQIPSDHAATRGCVLSSAHQFVNGLGSDRVRKALGPSSFDLHDLMAGDEPLSIFLVIPPDRSVSHRGLLRVWLMTLLRAVSERKTIPRRRTLFMIDECAHLGRLDLLAPMHGFLRALGCNVWTIWQSLAQLRSLYEKDWPTIVENTALVQAFGLHATAVPAIAELIGVRPGELRVLNPGEQMVAWANRLPEVMNRIDYRTHRLFRGMADPNPRYRS